ncbi:MAG TPA: hypothetical protein VHW25_05030 [Steroidobacteraceae bacterium]|jgi:hypothetical protein|nr:hypothetical protein [Steroidobacteraceae bacterium]
MSKICTPVFAVLAMAILGTQAQAQSAAHARSSAPAAKSRALDLTAPPLNHIMPRAQLRYILANEDADAELPTEVSVKGTKIVVVPGGPGNQLQAIPWAILHPTQAWRIFTPLEEAP